MTHTFLNVLIHDCYSYTLQEVDRLVVHIQGESEEVENVKQVVEADEAVASQGMNCYLIS